MATPIVPTPPPTTRVYYPSSQFTFGGGLLQPKGEKKIDLARQSVAVPGSQEPGYSPIFRNALLPDRLMVTDDEAVHTLYDNFNKGVALAPSGPCAGHRRYDPLTKKYSDTYYWQTYKDIEARRDLFGAGLMKVREEIGLHNSKIGKLKGFTDKYQGPQGFTVGIWSLNRPEWLITDQANSAYSNVSIALYDTLGAETVEYCVKDSELSIIVASAARCADLLSLSNKLVPVVKALICMDDEEAFGPDGNKLEVLRKWSKSVGIRFYSFGEVEKLGREFPREHIPPSPDSIMSISYTSGTTGNPKGVLLTHKNMLAAKAASSLLYNSHDVNEGGVKALLSYLPLAHIYERNVENWWLGAGQAVGYFHGDIFGLLEDATVLKPWLFPSVPRLINRIVSSVQAKLDLPGFKGFLAKKAVEAKLKNLADSQQFTHALWDNLVFRKVRDALGGNVGLVVSGAAPIAPETMNFMKAAFRSFAVEGYGATETSAACTVEHPKDFKRSIGPPSACNEIRLRDLPEMNYTSKNGFPMKGELLVRGNNVFVGYYGMEDKTREALDDQGWYHTGDVASVDEAGRFRIVDRVKNIYKLAQGEYVAPEKLESELASALPLIAQIFIHGDSNKAHLVAIVSVEPERFSAFSKGVTGEEVAMTDLPALEKACKNPKVVQAFMKEVERAAKSLKFQGFEVPRQVHLLHTPFSMDLLTPTLKMKRNIASDYFKTIINDLYSNFKEKENENAPGTIRAKL
eukprot:TRINITY_DN2096_c0_g1_i1.p1 TRINITY_DN2096_c0_g1~~TRINITY_DN2096_c0_g1_i1.p1  ORF type:complete len:742 (+),score=270.69 TRINITY_DN2096_c0_g1_i1:125-2350(+)